MASRADIPSYGAPKTLERHSQGSFIGRHRHHVGYATVVLSGSYEEQGDEGRFQLSPGEVIVHQPFEAHQNIIAPRGAVMISFEISAGLHHVTHAIVDDPDFIARLNERDSREAYRALASMVRPLKPANRGDWPDLLARWLRENPRGRISEWAKQAGLSREAVARGFRKAFGVDPVRFRGEARSRAALQAIRSTGLRLCDIAAEHGFADQAHMTREIKAISGFPPSAWRRSHSFKTAAAS